MLIDRRTPSKLLTPASGFLQGYSHTLNPYVGCQFACSYCYVREMPVAKFRGIEWGTWVDVKEQAAEKFRKELRTAKKKGPVTIFMSSATDPYQPVEYKEQITRSLIQVMTEEHPDYLFLQTRSPLVLRDMDLLERLKDRLRISITIETDWEEMRKVFTPQAPPIAARMRALRTFFQAGYDVQAAVSPILPSSDQFVEKLSACTSRVVLDNFVGDGSGGKRSARLGLLKKYEERDLQKWYAPEAINHVHEQFSKHFTDDQLFISQCGFLPG
ncbi:SPL family radical SAM protein [Brevibacillus sp. SYSU BS000544]|uniref:SPL family radical SAM protein n=1 Tax=Brevibacillus sp. SYSU BS000544 TaxID=3416443 RepID=UPI003CE54E50